LKLTSTADQLEKKYIKFRKSEATGRNIRKVGNYSFGPRRLKNLKQNVL
jgi:hypothetical protein